MHGNRNLKIWYMVLIGYFILRKEIGLQELCYGSRIWRAKYYLDAHVYFHYCVKQDRKSWKWYSEVL